MKRVATLLTALAVLCLVGGTASADLNNLDIGGDVKVMAVYTENVMDFNDDGLVIPVVNMNYDDQDDFLRVEAHLWFQADLSDNVTAKVSVEVDRDWEADVENIPDANPVSLAISAARDDLNVFLEEAWIQMAYIYDTPISIKLGRQFIELGDGFVIGDGNPLYPFFLNVLGEYEVDPFDAVLVWYDGDDWVLNFMYAKLYESRQLDNIYSGDMDAYSVYFTYSGVEGYEFDLYFIMENWDWVPLASLIVGGGNGAEIYAVGARVAGEPVEGLNFKLEGLYEFGEVDLGTNVSPDIDAWAVEASLKYVFPVEYNPFLSFTYVFMSGQDANDSDLENYILLFQNRVYGEIFDPYTNLGNMHIFNLGAGLDISEDIAISAQYYYFHTDDEGIWVDDDALGHEVDAYIDYQFSEETSAVLAGGFFLPEEAVDDTFGDDTAWFVRAGVKVEF